MNGKRRITPHEGFRITINNSHESLKTGIQHLKHRTST